MRAHPRLKVSGCVPHTQYANLRRVAQLERGSAKTSASSAQDGPVPMGDDIIPNCRLVGRPEKVDYSQEVDDNQRGKVQGLVTCCLSLSLVSEAELEGVPSSRFKNNYFAKLWSGSEEDSYLRLIDFCIT